MQFDHIAISGTDLEEAAAWVEDALGVRLQTGGAHDVFHTHNRVLGLADGLYLEAIAINPEAPQPDRPRWFDLDRFSGPPRLTNWICRCEDLDTELRRLPLGFGRPVDLQRDTLRWRMAVPDDGILPFDNCAPALIEWQTPVHPAKRLVPSGIRLTRLTVRHPEAEKLKALVAPALGDDRVAYETGSAGLHAAFETPRGPRELEA
ncbi:VOC family protein [Sulfitobacter sp. D35]|uniref:VOC family protein n=1 Tax=Sulfitobacter sp. D35 TaxID=3083252 RepID=UPI00296FCB64|nr:VOC family protein [Sulfitobacter sp. D35]MDW4499563.1 VOC family protein [Sulfitobacter sp. D35]